MERRRFVTGCTCCGLLAGASTLLAAGQAVLPARLERPEPGSDEGGLWSLLTREEERLQRSRFLLRDEALNAYVSGLACRLAGEHCPDVRVYIVRSPFFNASMAPNGMLQVWTGLLLRMDNEAQLAAVLGHEIGHYVGRHSLEQLRDAKSRTALGQFLGMAFSAAGVGAAGSIAQLALLAGMFAYSREHEHEADRIGQELVAAAGYPPIEAAKVWQQLIAELKAEAEWSGDAGSRSIFFASHPDPEERSQVMASRAATMNGDRGDVASAPYARQIRGHRRQWLEDELRRRKAGETIALCERLLRQSDDGETRFFLGEAYRLRAGAGDGARALAEYALAGSRSDCPPEMYRSRGLLQRQAGETAAASASFSRYLALRPAADDAEMIRSYLQEGR
ncbi:MAG: M48 family metalloprotease [Accumulibacter sp.]